MEVNKDEARRCLDIAKSKEKNDDLTAALKFIKKSISLFPTPEAEAQRARIESKLSSSQASPRASTPNGNGNGLLKRDPPTSSKPTQRTDSGSSSRSYTAQQVEAVKKIKSNAGDFYAILDIQKTATDGDIKKSYRKLALQFHPDKNSAPGADEAFKLVSKAFAILSDADKRSQYDRYGGDPEQRGGGGGGGGGFPTHGNQHFAFQDEVSPEELFNMFFGGGFGNRGFQSATFVGADGRRYVRQFGGGQRGRQARANTTEQGGGLSFNILQLLPVLLLFGFSLLSSFFSPSGPDDPGYSFSKTNRYSQPMATRQRRVNYFINPRQFNDFKSQVKDNRIHSFERDIENHYIQALYNQCQHERQIQNRDLLSAQGVFGWGKDEKKVAEIKSRPLPKCVELNQYMN